jgi:hypothetical protein
MPTSTRAGYSASSLLHPSLKKRTQKVVGYETPEVRFYCPDCIPTGLKARSTPIRANETTDWDISCEKCQETILEMEVED